MISCIFVAVLFMIESLRLLISSNNLWLYYFYNYIFYSALYVFLDP
jgi:hypothetical protein